MKWAKADIICTSFFQLYKAPDDINNVEAAKDLLYGVLGDHFSLYPDCEYSTSEFWPILNSEPQSDFQAFLIIFQK